VKTKEKTTATKRFDDEITNKKGKKN